MFELTTDTDFWIGVLQIIAIDVLLGGDNAVVIALACRGLPKHQRNRGIFWGVFGAVTLRILLIFFALQLLALPYLKSVGALLLVWIGIKLMQPEHAEGHASVKSSTRLAGAIRTIVLADAVMSLDNVIAVAGAAKGDLKLVVFGILVSVPIIVWGSKIVLRLMDRFPIAIPLGAGLLGWIAGGMVVTDPGILQRDLPVWQSYAAHGAGAALVVLVGMALARRAVKRQLVDLAAGGTAAETPPSEVLRREET